MGCRPPGLRCSPRVVVYDHRGTGQSDKPEDPAGYTSRQFARDAVAILDAVGIGRAHVYGVSMGGGIAQWVAIDHADRVGALVLGCTTPGGPNKVPTAAWIMEARQDSDPQAWARVAASLVFSPEWAEAHPEVARAVLAPEGTPPEMRRLHNQISPTNNTWDQLPLISAPTLVIHGSDDEMVPVGNARLLAERIPAAELHIVQGGRHGYLMEYQEETSRVVLDFLARHPLRATGTAPSATQGDA
ncbi:MAG: alpha/beta hydrolase [Chloroflexota bacterium]|nr:alpha/beta hydrolase [Chloroflexota bacterium]